MQERIYFLVFHIIAWGICLSGLWKKIKKMRRGSRAARMLCDHFQRWGIDARMIEEEGDRVALNGQEIDVVKAHRFSGGEYGPPSYSFYYGVCRDVKGIERVNTRMQVETKGLLGREIIDLKWVGGELADQLNKDNVLREQMLQQLKIDGRESIEISPDKKAGVVWITTTKHISPFPKSAMPFSIPDDIMPSEASFRLYTTIAKHIRKLPQQAKVYAQERNDVKSKRIVIIFVIVAAAVFAIVVWFVASTQGPPPIETAKFSGGTPFSSEVLVTDVFQVSSEKWTINLVSGSTLPGWSLRVELYEEGEYDTPARSLIGKWDLLGECVVWALNPETAKGTFPSPTDYQPGLPPGRYYLEVHWTRITWTIHIFEEA